MHELQRERDSTSAAAAQLQQEMEQAMTLATQPPVDTTGGGVTADTVDRSATPVDGTFTTVNLGPSSGVSPAEANNLVQLRNKVDELTEQLQASMQDLGKERDTILALQAELAETKTREQEEIYKREARLRELESRLGEGLGNFTVQDINTRDEEIAQLRKANEEAQAWSKFATLDFLISWSNVA